MRINNKGISLISLIVTIVVIIILASFVLWNGLNAPDRATFARFVTEIDDFNLAIINDCIQKQTDFSLKGEMRSKAQVYYMIASGKDTIGKNEEPVASGKVSELGFEILPSELKGTEYYEITSDTNVENWKEETKYYSPDEKHYVTDEGVAFVLPGYLVEEDGTNKWWINDELYYVGEGATVPEEEVIADYWIYETNADGTMAITGIDFNELEINGSIYEEYIVELDKVLEIPETINGKTVTKFSLSDSTYLDNFTNIKGVERVVFPNTIKTIEGGWNKIYFTTPKEIIFPNNLEILDSNLFAYNDELTQVVLPDKLTLIGEFAFYSCSNLTSITIPISLQTVKSEAFGYCERLRNVYYKGTETQWNNISIDEDGNSYLIDATKTYEY